MKFEFHLDENDYLHYLFYSTSKSNKVQKRRALNKLVFMIIYVMTGFFLFNKNGPIASAAFFLVCLPLYFLYNAFEKKQYNRHFKKFIQIHFKERLGKSATIEFGPDSFHLVDDEDITVPYSEIEEIMESNAMMVLKLKNGQDIILPKNKIESIDLLISKVNEFGISKNIKTTKDLAWKWK